MIEQKQDRLLNLLNSGKIDRYEYDSYLLFEVGDQGRTYLKNALDAVVLECPLKCNKDNVMWVDGRRSVWRDVRLAIVKVNQLLEGDVNERPKFPDLEWYGKQ